MNFQVQTLLEQARTNRINGEIQKAFILLKKAQVLISPHDSASQGRVYWEMALLYTSTNDHKSATELAKKACECEPELISDIRKWATENKKGKTKEVAKQILIDTKKIAVKNDPIALSNNLSKKTRFYLVAAVLVVAILMSLLLYSFKFNFGLTDQPKKINITRINQNVGQIFLIATITDSNTGEEVTIPLNLGSCFAVSGQGYLITNRHITDVFRDVKKSNVLLDSKMIVAFSSDANDRFTAKVIHECPDADAALLKIEKFFPTPFDEVSMDIEQGETIIACGYPAAVYDLVTELDVSRIWKNLGEKIRELHRTGKTDFFALVPAAAFTVSVTQGIISSVRKVDSAEYVQTDAAMLPGNSGGPLLTRAGKVVGISTLKHSGNESTNLGISMRAITKDFAPWVVFRD